MRDLLGLGRGLCFAVLAHQNIANVRCYGRRPRLVSSDAFESSPIDARRLVPLQRSSSQPFNSQ